MPTPSFKGELRQEVVQPRVDAVSRGDGPQADPAVKFRLRSTDVRTRRDIERLNQVLSRSRTFRRLESWLRKTGVEVTVVLGEVKGGGTTTGVAGGKRHGIILDPAQVPEGYHILDVLIHEWAHLATEYGFVDDRKRPYQLQPFIHQVQEELEIRQTPDSHGDGEVEEGR